MTFSLKGLKTITNNQYEPACGILSLLDIYNRLHLTLLVYRFVAIILGCVPINCTHISISDILTKQGSITVGCYHPFRWPPLDVSTGVCTFSGCTFPGMYLPGERGVSSRGMYLAYPPLPHRRDLGPGIHTLL